MRILLFRVPYFGVLRIRFEFRVEGSGFRVEGVGFRVQGLEFRV